MPYKVVKFESTPNPNALKCVLDRAVTPIADKEGPSRDGSARSYRRAEDAESDPLARAIFECALPGSITSVLIRADWIAVNKAPDEDWKRLRGAISTAVAKAE